MNTRTMIMGVTTHYYGQIIVNEMCASYKRRETVGAACIDDACGGNTQNRFVHCENIELKECSDSMNHVDKIGR